MIQKTLSTHSLLTICTPCIQSSKLSLLELFLLDTMNLSEWLLQYLAKYRLYVHLATSFLQLNSWWETMHSFQQFLHNSIVPPKQYESECVSSYAHLQYIPPKFLSQNRLYRRAPCGHLCTSWKQKFHVVCSELLIWNRLYQCTPCRHYALLPQAHRRETIETHLISHRFINSTM